MRSQGDDDSLIATDEELMQDLLTRKILMTNDMNSDDANLTSKPDLMQGR